MEYEFQLADTDRKRLIISQLYSRIEIGRGYKLRFVLDANYQQFLDGQADTTVSDFVAKLARKNTVPYMAPAVASAATVAIGA